MPEMPEGVAGPNWGSSVSGGKVSSSRPVGNLRSEIGELRMGISKAMIYLAHHERMNQWKS